jgi:hypothetical protein
MPGTLPQSKRNGSHRQRLLPGIGAVNKARAPKAPPKSGTQDAVCFRRTTPTQNTDQFRAVIQIKRANKMTERTHENVFMGNLVHKYFQALGVAYNNRNHLPLEPESPRVVRGQTSIPKLVIHASYVAKFLFCHIPPHDVSNKDDPYSRVNEEKSPGFCKRYSMPPGEY